MSSNSDGNANSETASGPAGMAGEPLANGGPASKRRVRLLVWDEHDVRARQADVLVADSPAEADLEQVYLWLSGRCQGGESPEACLFTAIKPGTEEAAAAEVTRIRMLGFGVLAKIQPTLGQADLSAAMWEHIERVTAEAEVAEVLVASHDGASFGPRLAGLAQRGITVTVVGFREKAAYAAGRAGVAFVDLEAVPGAFTSPLPRTNLFDLPSEGRLLPPLRRPASAGSPVAAPASQTETMPAQVGTPARPAAGLTAPSAPATAPGAITPIAPAAPGAPPAPPAPPLPSRFSTVAAPATVPVGGNPVIDLTAEERAPQPPEGTDHTPPPPPPPPAWQAASTPTGPGAADAPRPGRVMPPPTGS